MDNKDHSKLCDEEKLKGNNQYKARNFNEALKHYDTALEYDPTNIIIINNKAAVFIDQGNYRDCIELCENSLKLIDKNKVERKTIAKSYYRLAKAYEKLNDLENSLKFYDYSIIEDRNPAVIKIAQKMELDLEDLQKNAYINFDISEAENQKGNKCFKNENYNKAASHYNEAIKRSPNDVRRYFNRALCYFKMKEFTLSLQDAETCTSIDPSYIQAYLIRGKLFRKLKTFSKAHLEYEKAIDIDSNCKEALKGYKITSKESGLDPTAPEVVQRRIQRNPELKAILSEPGITKILYEIQNKPESMETYMKDPDIRKKINKLISCGLLTIEPTLEDDK